MRESAPSVAFGIVRRELLAARRVRSRARFQFWATVRDEISSFESILPPGEVEADKKFLLDAQPEKLSSKA